MKIFCSGIGGIGVSAYAALQKGLGHDVSGTDSSISPILDALRGMGINVSIDQGGSEVPEHCDLFVYSEAIPESSPERKRAKELGIPQKSYPEALSLLTAGHRLVAVCGTHGKSSTTAMAARLCMDKGMDPTVVVGTKMRELQGRNWRKGNSNLFIIEACEYRRSFLNYAPEIVILTNCDGDHFDYYASTVEYQQAFVDFLSKLPPHGIIITHGTDPDCKAVAEKSGKHIIDADAFPMIPLHTPGHHMQENAQLVLALSNVLGIQTDEAAKSLEGYEGSWRRMEVKGDTDSGVTVIDDYAHHPREIRATIAAMRGEYKDRRIVCVFQPHTHDRTLKLYDDFTRAFAGVNTVIVPNIYVARKEIESTTVDVTTFTKDIAAQSNVEAIDGHSLEKTKELLQQNILRPKDVLLCMGAGDITSLAAQMLSEPGSV